MSETLHAVWKGAQAILGTVAPLLATAVGGPFGGMATKAIISALGLPRDTPTEDVADAVLNATPEQLLAVKSADNEFKAAMKKLDVTSEQLAYADTADARAREVALGGDWVTRLLALMVVGAALTAALMVLAGYSQVDSPLAGAMVQMLMGAALTVLGYYYGSSRGSHQKDKLIADRSAH